MRLIDADALRQEIFFNDYSPLKIDDNSNALGNEILRIIDNAPTIDDLSEYSDKLWKQAYERGKAEARPQGEWFLLDECSNEGVYCSNCHKKVYRVEYANQKVKSNYCPNCGADMREEADNEIM